MKSITLSLFVMSLILSQTEFSYALRLTGPIASLSEYKIDESDCVRFAFKTFKKCTNFLKKNFESGNDILYKNIIQYKKVKCNDDKNKCIFVNNIIKELQNKKGINENTKITIKSQVQSKTKLNLRVNNTQNIKSQLTINDKYISMCIKIMIIILVFFILYMIFRMKLLSFLVERLFNPLNVKCNYETISEAMTDNNINAFLFEREDSFFKQKYGKNFLLSEYDSVLILTEIYNILNGDINTLTKEQIEFSISLFAMIMEMKKRQFKKSMNIKISSTFGILFIISLCLVIFYFK